MIDATEKRFKLCHDPIGRDLCPKQTTHAAYAAFGYAITDLTMTRKEAEGLFEKLAVGETLIDEDGEQWERIA